MEYFTLLNHRSDEIIKFIANCGIFSLLLKNGKVIHFTPDDPDHFMEWLNRKGIKNIKRQQSNRLKEEEITS